MKLARLAVRDPRGLVAGLTVFGRIVTLPNDNSIKMADLHRRR